MLDDVDAQIKAALGEMRVQIADDVKGVALELRQRASDNALAMLGTEPGAPTLASSFKVSVGSLPAAEKHPAPGDEAMARAELAQWKQGEPIFVYSDVYYAYFHEFGYAHTNGTVKPAVGFLRAAVEAVGNG